jgi:hypothetical protein
MHLVNGSQSHLLVFCETALDDLKIVSYYWGGFFMYDYNL